MVALNKTYRKTLTPDRSAKDSGHRFYSPEISRWLSRDPIGETGGDNLYAFVFNSSINAFDFLGFSWWWVDGLYAFGANNDKVAAENYKKGCIDNTIAIVTFAATEPATSYELHWKTYNPDTGKWESETVGWDVFFTRLLDEHYEWVKAPMQSLASQIEALQTIVGMHSNPWDTTGFIYHTYAGDYVPFVGPNAPMSTVVQQLADVVPSTGRFVPASCVPAPIVLGEEPSWLEKWKLEPYPPEPGGSSEDPKTSCSWSYVVTEEGKCTLEWRAGGLRKALLQ